MLFSIITPSLNQGRFIEETIKGVLSQEGDFSIEYIIVDGGSRDGTIETIKRYAGLVNGGRYPLRCRGVSLKWVSEADSGQSEAINKGFRMASGDIFSWVNADDMYVEGAFSKVKEFLEKHGGSDFVYGDGEIIDGEGRVIQPWRSRPYSLKLLRTHHFLYHEFSNYILQPAVFWRKGVFRGIGYIDETLHYSMDLEYWIRAGVHGLKFGYIKERLAKFRLGKGSKTSSSPTVFWPDCLEVFRRYNGIKGMSRFFAEFFYSIASANGFDVPASSRAFDEALRRWDSLGAKELMILTDEARAGRRVGLVKAANALFVRGEKERAVIAFRQASAEGPGVFLSPWSIAFFLKRLMGRTLSAKALRACDAGLKACWHILYNRRG
jgi:glycosyltransferase involved in cell wall biosynthesis